MLDKTIRLELAELAEGLRMLREYERLHGLAHLAEADMQRYTAHLAVLHNVPNGYGLKDWAVGFEPLAVELPAEDATKTGGN